MLGLPFWYDFICIKIFLCQRRRFGPDLHNGYINLTHYTSKMSPAMYIKNTSIKARSVMKGIRINEKQKWVRYK